MPDSQVGNTRETPWNLSEPIPLILPTLLSPLSPLAPLFWFRFITSHLTLIPLTTTIPFLSEPIPAPNRCIRGAHAMSSPDEVRTSRISKMKRWSEFLLPPRLATLYERQVARILRRPLAGPLAMATTGSAPKTGEDLDRRSALFVKHCRKEWLGLFVLGVSLSVYVTREP